MNEFQKRRYEFMDNCSSNTILFSGSEQKRNGDQTYPFRADSYFYYLTGITLPNCAAIFLPKLRKYILCVDPATDFTKTWLGYTQSHIEMQQTFFCDEIYSFKEYKRLSNKFDCKKISFKPILKCLIDMRLVKSIEELLFIENSLSITKKMFDSLKDIPKKGHERDVHALLWNQIHMNDAQVPYAPIATVKGAVLHQDRALNSLQKNSFLLVDAAAEKNMYASDITRTFFLGKPNKMQIALQELVRKTKEDTIKKVRIDMLFKDVHIFAADMLTKGMMDLGFLKGTFEELKEKNSISTFFPHGIGHHLGLDVHDCPEMKKFSRKIQKEWYILKEHMVITIEPGIYFNRYLLEKADPQYVNKKLCDKFIDQGIREEDTIVVTQVGGKRLGPKI